MFIYRNLKSLLYIFLATASICGAAFQLSNFYLSKQDIPDSQNIVGYLITEGEQVIVKKAQAHAGTLAIHGQILLSNDTIKTLEASVVIEVGQHKLRILPYSDVNVKKNGDKFEFYLSSGSVIALTKKADKVITLFEQNNGQFAQLPLLGPTTQDKSALFQVKDISLIADSNGPQLQFKWAADSEIKNRWVEFYAGHDKSHLKLVKAYPFETGGFKEVWSMPQFYWQVIVKENDAAVETSPVTFWKNEFQSKINLIYPADKEVINNVLNPEDFILRWSKAANVGRVKVQVFRNNVMETELDAGLKNQVQFKPAQYGFYYWRVLNDHGVFTEPRSFFYAPLASVDSDVLSWSEGVEPKQFYYRDSIMHLKWKKTTKLPVAKYKITLIYIQESKDGDMKQVKENLFVDGDEANIRLDASTPIKVRVEPYNNKMQILGKALNQEVTLVKRTGKQQPLVLTNHEKTKKNEVITDRNYSLNFDKSSMSPLYEYPYEVIGADKKVVKTGVITKGQSLSLKGLPIDYYQVKMRIEDKKLKNLIESQNLANKDAKSRLPASQNQVIEQGFAVKLIPPTDFNTSQSGVITPQVENVEISN